jgi:hypothetical protein
VTDTPDPLLPCPFCGNDDLCTDNARDFIACCNCGTEGPVGIGQGSAHNIARWNVRAALAAPRQAPQPVAWLLDGTHHVEFDPQPYHSSAEWVPLYGSPLYAGASPQAAVPAEWTKAVQEAYGWLWNINNEPMAPIPLLDEGKAAYQARKALRDLLTSDQRGEAINAVRATIENLLAARPQAQPTPTDTPT